jgi:hypothetical protein
MVAYACPVLEACLERYAKAGDADDIRYRLSCAATAADMLPLYDRMIPVVEAAMWASDLAPQDVAACQALFGEREAQQAHCKETRHKLYVVVPVADRPRHLRSCLESLVNAVFSFGNALNRIAVVIADDSCAASSISANQTLARELQQRGLETLYFGREEQQAELARLSDQTREAIRHIIDPLQPADFAHKGASTTRNITYLRLNRLANAEPRALFLFVDSDQEFHANTDAGRRVYTTNYYYHIDRLFSTTPIEVLTGKVVGDPPVSPAVMAGTLLEDVLALLREMATLDPDSACSFHRAPTPDDGAAYHDMAQLFGFKACGEAYRYHCNIEGPHDHAACLSRFSRRLQHFFDGEHPTRVTRYRHVDVQDSWTPARTVYTGNYVLTPATLRYFIPFAGLQLRMAGPVLGRLVQAGSGPAFASANLPLLHKRTEEQTGQSEFRPGIDRAGSEADLSGEFERQYFGDVMLFTVIELVEQGYPDTVLSTATIEAAIAATDARLRAQYAETRARVLARLAELEALLEDPAAWWNTAAAADTRARFAAFIASLHTNFDQDAPAWQLISDPAHHAQRCADMLAALASYRMDCHQWRHVLQAS